MFSHRPMSPQSRH
ncbi:hypothetical protein CFP56_021521 [Quercus suber]|uniref:Uncharacterized protein n=1 Tax=Quercus suber TaxID=58331 RepID=A0AAW0M195_QUESU